MPEVLGTYSRPRAQFFSHTDRPNDVVRVVGFLLLRAGKEIYRHHLVQSFFLRIVTFAFTAVRSHQNPFSQGLDCYSGERIWPVGRNVKSWIGHIRVLSQ